MLAIFINYYFFCIAIYKKFTSFHNSIFLYARYQFLFMSYFPNFIKYIINRPVAVNMVFVSILILGTISAFNIPISLMPDIDIPRITVQLSNKNASAREIENTIAKPLRRELIQLNHIVDVNSECRDGHMTLNLSFDFNTNIDLAFIEVNEKIDRAIVHFSRDIERPRVIKASITDLPVFYLNLTLNESKNDSSNKFNKISYHDEFIGLSEFATQVIRKRLEQLPEVAMADISGLSSAEIFVIPDIKKINSLNISLEQIESSIKEHNIEFSNLVIHDGYYQYNLRFNNKLSNKVDIENIYLNINKKRLLQLKDIAKVDVRRQKRRGLITSEGKDAVCIAIIKQSSARMNNMKKSLDELIVEFKKDYPDINFNINRDQTTLLDYSISNLFQDLMWGGIFSFLLMFYFLKDFKSPLLIGIILPSSLVITMLMFYFLKLSINIISLSGLVLVMGMMIDNSIIVIDNIAQYKEKGISLLDSCVKGSNDVFVPMLSSALTTCAVFIPLIYLSGISGALFYDEAVSVVVGTLVSLILSVTIIPVYYSLIFKREEKKVSFKSIFFLKTNKYEYYYEKSFVFLMRNPKYLLIFLTIIFLLGIYSFVTLPKLKFPVITKSDTILKIDWNNKINVNENNRRIKVLLNEVKHLTKYYSSEIGEQDFLLNRKSGLNSSESIVYIEAKSSILIDSIKKILNNHIKTIYNQNVVHNFLDSENQFNFIFLDNEAPLIVHLKFKNEIEEQKGEILISIINELKSCFPELNISDLPIEESILLKLDFLKMVLFNFSFDHVYLQLKELFGEKETIKIASNSGYTPIVLGGNSTSINQVLEKSFITNNDGKLFPLKSLISENRIIDFKSIYAGKDGEYYPIEINLNRDSIENAVDKIKKIINKNEFVKVNFTGSYFSSSKLIKELMFILLISLLLLYLILASQFESFLLPLIILIEIPIDIVASFIFLKLFNSSINLLSLIGIVIMCGIIINDSILKIDTINKIRSSGNSILKSVALGGKRRLKPILMTSITTILGMLPLLFTSGIGAELQKPLAIVLVGGMTVGTILSLYFVPYCYFYIFKKI